MTTGKRRVNLLDYRLPGQTAWDLPPWNHEIGQGIMPLCVIVGQRLVPIGTAFLVSKIGIIATAAHVIYDAIREDQKAHKAILGNDDLAEIAITKVQLVVLKPEIGETGEMGAVVWPVENLQIARPTDIAFGFLSVWNGLRAAFTLSPVVPRIGETVFSLGFCDSAVPEDGISLDDVESAKFNWASFSHRFHVVEGKVEAIFLEKFAAGYAEGPCFLTTANLRHGQSGGPVFNSAGNVCGINLGGADLFVPGRSLVSPIFPALPVQIHMSLKLGSSFSVKASHPLIDLMNQGSVRTDGSEKLAQIHAIDDSWRVDPMIHEDDANYVFRCFRDYQDSNPAKYGNEKNEPNSIE